MVFVVPQLARNKDLAPGYAALLYGFADSGLSSIAIGVNLGNSLSLCVYLPPCCVNVAIPCLKSYKNCCLLGSLILPGSQTYSRDLSTSGKLEVFLSVRGHCDIRDRKYVKSS